nr:hypothetical protein [Tanacetum cinerariifolium]
MLLFVNDSPYRELVDERLLLPPKQTPPERNRDDLDIMSLDDVYNHLKVYEPKVQKKSESNSQNMAFISSSNTSSGKVLSLAGPLPVSSKGPL